MRHFLGITREHVFSPGRVHDDGAILDMVADRLRHLGHCVSVCNGDDDAWPDPTADAVVFAMCQGPQALARLEQWLERGLRIINSPRAIRNCQRDRTLAALAGTGIAFPETVLLETNANGQRLPAWMADGGGWIKRADVHATEPDDVVRVADARAAERALHRLRDRGIARAVVQRHVAGVVLKFYAVRGRFFHCVPPAGADPLPAHVLRSIDALGQQAADRIGVEVYGGDCVRGVNGTLHLIDLNDWPSYASCRAEAASNIAAYLQAQEVARTP
jgi:hypothetical protein